jgi:hypothetical protein
VEMPKNATPMLPGEVGPEDEDENEDDDNYASNEANIA